MRPLVIDASAALAVVLRQPAESEVRRILGRHDGSVLAPAFFWLEVPNSLLRRHRRTGDEAVEAIRELEELGIESVETDAHARLLILDLAERHRLTTYDAAYVVLAETADARLLTTDREQARAAGARAILVDATGRIAEPPPAYEVAATWPSWRGASAYLGELRRRAAEGQ